MFSVFRASSLGLSAIAAQYRATIRLLVWISALLAVVLIGSDSGSGHGAAAFPFLRVVLAQSSDAKSPWVVETDEDEDTRELNIGAINESRPEVNLVIRKRGKKLELYVTTGEMLQQAPDGRTDQSVAKSSFDHGPAETQPWVLSSDKTALFFPGDPSSFIHRIREAKRLTIEYITARKTTETAVFELSPFPPEVAKSLDQER